MGKPREDIARRASEQVTAHILFCQKYKSQPKIIWHRETQGIMTYPADWKKQIKGPDNVSKEIQSI